MPKSPHDPIPQPQTSRKYVEVRLTPPQAWALMRLADSVIDEPEGLQTMFPHHNARRSAARARDAVSNAVHSWEDEFLK